MSCYALSSNGESRILVMDGFRGAHFLLLELSMSFIKEVGYRSACLYFDFSLIYWREDNVGVVGFDWE